MGRKKREHSEDTGTVSLQLRLPRALYAELVEVLSEVPTLRASSTIAHFLSGHRAELIQMAKVMANAAKGE